MYIMINTYIMKTTSALSRLQTAFLLEAAALWPCIKGSLAEVRKPCIRPACEACREGRKHAAHLLTFRQGGKTRCRYVPREWVAPLRQALANGRRLEKRLAVLSGELLAAYRQERNAKGAPRRVARKKPPQ